MRLTDLLALNHVPRWCIVPHLRPQSVAEHTFNVLVIVRELETITGVRLCANDLWYIINHDADESRSGDTPSLYKQWMPGHTAAKYKVCPWLSTEPIITDEIAALVKLADDIEAYTYIRQYGIGAHAERVATDTWNKVVASIERAGQIEHYARIVRLCTDITSSVDR